MVEAEIAGAAGVVTLREITAQNRAAVEALRVSEEQSGYVGGVTQSFEDALKDPEAEPRYWALYAGEEPVGFVMISDGIGPGHPDYLGPYYLWRLLVDERHQGRGYGAAAIRLVADYVRTRPDARVLLTSVVPGPATPRGFYLRQGFRDTGVDHDGERVLELDLALGGTAPAP